MKDFSCLGVKEKKFVVQNVYCDRCGKSCKKDGTYEYASLVASWGYFSRKDFTQNNFDICEDCFDGIVVEFKKTKFSIGDVVKIVGINFRESEEDTLGEIIGLSSVGYYRIKTKGNEAILHEDQLERVGLLC